MNISDTITDVRNGARRRISDVKADRLVKEKDELRTENRLLRDELAETRSERQHVLELLDKVTTPPEKKRRHRLLRLFAFGGAVYAVAAQTGAIDLARNWINAMRRRRMGLEAELMSNGAEVLHETADKIDPSVR